MFENHFTFKLTSKSFPLFLKLLIRRLSCSESQAGMFSLKILFVRSQLLTATRVKSNDGLNSSSFSYKGNIFHAEIWMPKLNDSDWLWLLLIFRQPIRTVFSFQNDLWTFAKMQTFVIFCCSHPIQNILGKFFASQKTINTRNCNLHRFDIVLWFDFVYLHAFL